MKKIVKQGALILALLGNAAFLTGPAVANSLHDEGDFGGGYRIIGPSGGPERYAYVRHHTFHRRGFFFKRIPDLRDLAPEKRSATSRIDL